MMFQNPALLWGILTVAVPIALHFWHQQRAAPMPWAMLRWLNMPAQPPKRGIRFNNIWLLVLRCLVLVALAAVLARPTAVTPPGNAAVGRVHLLEPDPAVVQTYRFELTQALARHEPIWWATSPLRPVTSLTDLPAGPPPNPLRWQAAFSALAPGGGLLHTYLANSPRWVEAPLLRVPAGFVLHAAPYVAPKQPLPVIALTGGKWLGVGANQRLQVLERGLANQKVVATAPLRVLLTCRQPLERATLLAALTALKTVYQLAYDLDYAPLANKRYDWVLADGPIANPAPATLYTLVGQPDNAHQPNITYLPDPPTAQTSDLVTAGQLPEWLATQLLHHLGLRLPPKPLTEAALTRLFVPAPSAADPDLPAARLENGWQTAFMVLFLSLLLAERYVALRRGL